MQNGIDFSDVQDHWGRPFILKLARIGIINGYGDGTFKPEKTITRAEFIKLFETARRGDEFFNNFSKGTEQWYDSYMDWARRDMIFENSDDFYSPNDIITRKEAAMIIGKLCENEGIMFSYNPSFFEADGIFEIGNFSDTEDFTGDEHFYLNYITELGIIGGYEDGTYKPDKNLTRAEVSKLVCAYIVQTRKEY